MRSRPYQPIAANSGVDENVTEMFKMRYGTYRLRAGTYIMVLGTAMLVAVLGLSALMALCIERRTAEMAGDFGQARLHGQAAIEMGFVRIASDPDLRTRRSIENGSMAWIFKTSVHIHPLVSSRKSTRICF